MQATLGKKQTPLIFLLGGDSGGTAIGAHSGDAVEEQAPAVPLRSAQFGARQNGVALRLSAPVIGREACVLEILYGVERSCWLLARGKGACFSLDALVREDESVCRAVLRCAEGLAPWFNGEW